MPCEYADPIDLLTFCDQLRTNGLMATRTKQRHAAAPKEDLTARKGRRWYFVVDMPGPDGKRRQVKRRGFETKGDAQAALDKLRVNAREGKHVDRTDITVGEYLTEWIARLADAELSDKTKSGYASDLRLHVIPRIGAVRLQSLTFEQVNELYADLLKPGANLRGKRDEHGNMANPKPLGSRSRKGVHIALNKALKDAERRRLIPSNPVALATAPRHEPTLSPDKVWSKSELKTFLEHVKGDELAPLWNLYAATGMRRGEALGLQFDDFTPDADRVKIQRAQVVNNYEVSTSKTKTRNSTRTIPLAARYAEIMKAHLDGRTGSEWVFTDAVGRPWHPERIAELFDQAVAASGVKRITLHALRHSYATHALEAGVPLTLVSRILGHSSVAVTGDMYSHVLDDTAMDAAELIAALLD